MCIICEKRYHTTSEHREQLNLKRDRDQFDEERDERDSKRKRENDNDDDERFNSKIDDEKEKAQDLHRYQSRDSDDHERHVSSRRVLNSENDLLLTQRTKQIDVHILRDVLETHLCQRFKKFDDRKKTRHCQIVLQDKQQTNEHFVLERILRSRVFF
jgi:hypothetical protein